ncbi:MAG: STAS domain-containing protein [Oscillospiraceae bacterium]|nr:STAS domain-containing protein [Oscillospiraceae bacterium]
MDIRYEKNRLTAYLTGEIDHHNAAAVRQPIDQAIAKLRPPRVRLDFAAVTFMDSSAVGLVMGRYKLLMAYDAALEVVNLSPTGLRMMQMANLQTLALLKQKEEISA